MDVRSELDSIWDAVVDITRRCDEQIRELRVCLATKEPSSEPTTSLSSAAEKRAGESQDGGTSKRSKTM